MVLWTDGGIFGYGGRRPYYVIFLIKKMYTLKVMNVDQQIPLIKYKNLPVSEKSVDFLFN